MEHDNFKRILNIFMCLAALVSLALGLMISGPTLMNARSDTAILALGFLVVGFVLTCWILISNFLLTEEG